MSFDKNYPNRKDHRKQFIGAKSFDHSCRNSGSCGYCQANRNINKTKVKLISKSELDTSLPEIDTLRFLETTNIEEFENGLGNELEYLKSATMEELDARDIYESKVSDNA